MRDRTCFLIGMPSSGKTTYLVSLANMLIMGEHETLLSLKNCDSLEGMENIQKEIENFNQFQPVGRTLGTSEGCVKIPLLNSQGKKTWLRIPDLSGEVFRDLVKERRLKKDIVSQLQSADMLLFFINVDIITPSRRILLGEESAIAIIEKDYKKSIVESAKAYSAETDMKKKRQVTQTDIVELLQCVLYLIQNRIKVKFVVSAWDSIKKQLAPENRIPEKCIERFLPLLFQFLHTNFRACIYRVKLV